MKPEKKSRALHGIGIGIGVFALLSTLCLLTPLRHPLLEIAGRDTPALEYRLQAQRDQMDALQKRASVSRLSPAERASLDQVRDAYVATRERLDARTRMNARLTVLGLFDWTRELFPWLLAFGFAFPVLGGLIGAQMGAQTNPQVQPGSRAPIAPSSTSTAAPPAPPVPPRPPAATPSAGAPARPAYIHPAAAAAAVTPAAPAKPPRPLPGSPVVLPPDPVKPPASTSVDAPAPTSVEPPAQDWGFRHQPTPLDSRPRTKLPPVRSPHILSDPSEDSSTDGSNNPALRD